jgi:hypothetical protein
VYQNEEAGDQMRIEEIVLANLDPHLSEYRASSLQLPEIRLTLPLLIQEALTQKPLDPLKPPFPKGLPQ